MNERGLAESSTHSSLCNGRVIVMSMPPEHAEMASKICAELGIEAAPLDALVERAAIVIGMEFGEEVPLVERLSAIHEEVCRHAELANIPIDELNGDAEALAPFQPRS